MIECGDVVALPGATLEQHGPEMFTAPAFDSRRLEPGNLFFALTAERDGHEFIDAAIDGGATGVVVSKPVAVPEGVAVISVPDTLEALQELGRVARRKYEGGIIAITGSAGKTTLRGIVTDVLRAGFQVHASIGSFNNHLGLPLTLLGIESDDSHAVLEVGTNNPGEIGFLGEMAEPDLAVVANVGYAHIGNFESPLDLVAEKVELLRTVSGGGTWVINGDDERIANAAKSIDRPDVTCITVGFGSDNDWRVTDVSVTEQGTTGSIVFDGSAYQFTLGLYGRHFATAAAMAVAIGHHYGLPIEDGVEALRQVKPEAGRAGLVRVDESLIVIDDTYNASPDAMLAGLDLLEDVSADNKVAVLGEMRELGAWSQRLHQTVLERAVQVADRVIIIGDHTSDIITAGAVIEGRERVVPAPSATAAFHDAVASLNRSGGSAAVFVKGSRFAHTERVILGLQGRTPRCELTVCPLYINCRTCDNLEVG